jgi:hypothetical protein
MAEENESYAAYFQPAKRAATVPEDTLDHRFSFFKVMHDLDAGPTSGRLREHAVLVIGDGLFDLLAAVSVEAACMGLASPGFPRIASGRARQRSIEATANARARRTLGAIVPGQADPDFTGPGTRRLAEVIRQGGLWNSPKRCHPDVPADD